MIRIVETTPMGRTIVTVLEDQRLVAHMYSSYQPFVVIKPENVALESPGGFHTFDAPAPLLIEWVDGPR